MTTRNADVTVTMEEYNEYGSMQLQPTACRLIFYKPTGRGL